MKRLLALLNEIAGWIFPPTYIDVPPKPIARIEYWRSPWDQQYHWHKRATGNNEIVSHGEAYHNRKDLIDTLEKFESGVPRREVPER